MTCLTLCVVHIGPYSMPLFAPRGTACIICAWRCVDRLKTLPSLPAGLLLVASPLSWINERAVGCATEARSMIRPCAFSRAHHNVRTQDFGDGHIRHWSRHPGHVSNGLHLASAITLRYEQRTCACWWYHRSHAGLACTQQWSRSLPVAATATMRRGPCHLRPSSGRG